MSEAVPPVTPEHFEYLVEVAGLCNLRCPSCPNGNTELAGRPKGFMDPTLFEKVIQKIALDSKGKTVALSLYNWGEPILSPHLPKLIEISNRYGFPPHISSNFVRVKSLEEVIKARPASLRISLSGFYQENYAKTHTGGNILEVKANAYKLRILMDSLGIQIPVHFFFHEYVHNMNEDREKIMELAKELGFDFVSTRAFYTPVEKVLSYLHGDATSSEIELINRLLVRPEEIRDIAKKYRKESPDCRLRSASMVIDYDGTVPLCCASFSRDYYISNSFLETSHADLQKSKYKNPLCGPCMANGIDMGYLFYHYPEMTAIKERRLSERQSATPTAALSETHGK
jgi:MoaA/NifB/PqqE/SkfB family radical SAM enzyme